MGVRIKFLVAAIFVGISVEAVASDLSALKFCVNQGYSSMTDRNGIVAAVVDDDGWQVMTFGAAQADQLFEIGSVTKKLRPARNGTILTSACHCLA